MPCVSLCVAPASLDANHLNVVTRRKETPLSIFLRDAGDLLIAAVSRCYTDFEEILASGIIPDRGCYVSGGFHRRGHLRRFCREQVHVGVGLSACRFHVAGLPQDHRRDTGQPSCRGGHETDRRKCRETIPVDHARPNCLIPITPAKRLGSDD
jgi:hypothetical protein